MLNAIARLLVSAGYEVEKAANGAEALARLEAHLETHPFDVLLSDVSMPGMDGVELLGRVRAFDLDLPVILMTGSPSIESVTKALEHGALRYLLKPVEGKVLDEVLGSAVRLHQLARMKRQALELLGFDKGQIGDRAGVEALFSRALDGLWVAYQPIVSLRQRKVVAYEALVRSDEPHLATPGALFDAADRLRRRWDLGRAIRAAVTLALGQGVPPHDVHINVDPYDLLDPELFADDTDFTRFSSRLVLEITERASLESIENVRLRVRSLRDKGFRIAIDDLGAGYAGLNNFAILEPDIVKIDMLLTRGIDRDPTKRKLVGGIVSLCQELGCTVVVEGVETREERDVLAELRCDLLQGYLFARPQRIPPRVELLDSTG